MVNNEFDSRVKVQQIIDSQLPEFILDESPKSVEFFKQYYISQEYQGGPVDIAENLDQYLKLDNLTPEVIVGSTILTSSISSSQTEIQVGSTKGFPSKYGLLKIDDEIITYTGLTTNSFTGCIRGFSGITDYHQELNQEELVFSTSNAAAHNSSSTVVNLSSIFLQEFYKKLKYSLTPGLENTDLVLDLNVGNFIKEASTLYKSKGTDESFRILFNVLFGETPKVINLEDFLIKSSSASYSRREVIVAEAISGDPLKLSGQTIVKTTDPQSTASVSEVEIIRRKNKTYYKLLLFVGYDDSFPTVTGQFNITGSTKNINYVSVGSSVITVDSTIGFPNSGKLYANGNIINYSSKSINQFFGCSGVNSGIATATTLRSEETYFGYEDGDTTKKVEIRLTGVLSDFNNTNQTSSVNPGEYIFVKNIGEVIKNPETDPTYKELFSNTWIYNTSSRYEIDSFGPGSINQLTVKTEIDKSSLKVGDTVEIVSRDSQQIAVTNLKVTQITNKTITTDSFFTLNTSFNYDVRRKVNLAKTTLVPLQYSETFCDVQNVYNADDEYMYVASNSLPSYDITIPIFSYNLLSLEDQNPDTGLYSILVFSKDISFITGSEVYYTHSQSPIPGLKEGIYYVQVLTGSRKVKLYSSRSAIGTSDNVKVGNITSGVHNFTLYSQKEKVLSPQKILRKFPLTISKSDEQSDETQVGPVGELVNGVEILSYKSDDKIYYGPLQSVNVLNSGSGYDVINTPVISVPGNAYIQPIVRGSLEKIFVDPQDFDIDIIVSVALTGGNGSGAVLEPVVEKRRREIEFDARQLVDGGGLDFQNETITFKSRHGLIDGQVITYDPVNNPSLGIGTFNGLNENTGLTLKKNVDYVAKYINDTTIQIYQSITDYNSGINTVGFTTIGNAGVHKFYTTPINTLSEIKVVNGGSGYENRILKVSSSGISSAYDTVTYINHGFNEGDLISYDYQTSAIVGLSTLNQYYVIKIDNDTFRLANAGVGGTYRSDYERGKYVTFGSTGTGYQTFKYPNIVLSVQYSSAGIGSTQFRGSIVATPVVKGEIVGTYLYDAGSDYGSKILNYHNKPTIEIKTGKNAQFNPIIVDGRISKVSVLFGGEEYYSIPEIKVVGVGTGAILRPVLQNDKISSVIVVNPGYGYSSSNTTVIAEPAGKGAIIDPQVRAISVNNNIIYKDIEDTNSQNSGEIIKVSNDNLQYNVCAYTGKLQNIFGDNISKHSPIIGWAYDGNPIYGSYGYSNPTDKNSSIVRVRSGYSLSSGNVSNRPSEFNLGFFVDDYKFTNSGDLDQYNGRFCVTPEFPNGVYAYFATSVLDTDGNIVGSFPYFIGEKYRSPFIQENRELDQSFDFNSSNLVRNTFPYRVSERYANNDFIVESNEIINQLSIVESVSTGSVDNFDIINSGTDYKVNDDLLFDETGTDGGGLIAKVSEIGGKTVENIQTTLTRYRDALFTWKNGQQIEVKIGPNHDLVDLDYVNVSGFSTELSLLNGTYQVGVSSYKSTLTKDIPTYSPVGVVTDISVSTIPENVSIGSSIKIDNEIFSILNIYRYQNVIRVSRTASGVAHTSPCEAFFIPDKFLIDKNYEYFNSTENDLVYFNPKQSVGVGTTSGVGIAVTYTIGSRNNNISIPTQSIYLPGHPFKNNQKVILKKPSAASPIFVSNVSTGSSFSLPFSGNEQVVYVIKKSVDHIGIVTQVGLTTTTNGLFFYTNGSDDYQYSLTSDFDQTIGDVQRVTARVSVSTSHQLRTGDTISLNIVPNLSVGIGTSSSVKLVFDSTNQKLITNPISFTSSAINVTTNEVTLINHGMKTGDKVVYSATVVAGGLSAGIYYIFKVDEDTIKLCETLKDTQSNPPLTVDITSAAASTHQIGLINPPLTAIKGNTLVFNLSDSSLVGYKFKLFSDKNFEDEFVSTGSTTQFSISGVGTVGISTNATLSLKYSDGMLLPLYYALEKSGYISTSDTDVKNYSQINFVDSYYNGNYKVTSVASTIFSISLQKQPENFLYNKNDCRNLEYVTNSQTATGPITKIRTISPGSNFKKLPIFDGVASTTGSNAYIIPQSNQVGKIKEVRIINNGFEYSSDKTLRPEASISKLLTIKDSNTISKVDILDGGKNYISAPNLIVFDVNTGQKIDSGFLSPNLVGSSIISVNVEQEPKGISDSAVDIRTINNTNGVRVESVKSSSSGIVTCVLVTPLSGFSQEPFASGDLIFVEGIQKYSTDGDGFNSEDYGYKFFKIENYSNAGTLLPRQLEFSGVSTNPGVAKTIQDFSGTIVNYKNYPKFSVTKSVSSFVIGENLEVNSGFGFISEDVKIVESNKNYIKVSGFYELKVGDIVRGIQSGTVATINSVQQSFGYFTVGYASTQRIGWSDDIGKLDEDTQVIPDNDYYQNLSYSVKSRQTWETIVSPVNNLLHTSGLKNFSDTEILRSVNLGIATSPSQYTNLLYKFVTENRVDTINNFDLVVDVDTINNSSIFLKFKNKKLTDYIECRTNRVLEIDDIGSQFNIQTDETQGFDLRYRNIPIFMKTFDPSNTSVLNPVTGTFSINNHFFNTGEELIYTPNSVGIGSSSAAVGIGLTLNNVGILTDVLPSTVYAIRIDNDNFKIATRKEYALANPAIAVTFTNVGYGNSHELEMVKKNDKSIITINNVAQSPIAYSLLNYTLNNGSSIGSGTSIFTLSGIGSIAPNDILRIDNEYMKVINVGFGTAYTGPISFAGTFPLVSVQRGFVGSSATSHTNLSNVSLYRGSFNIVKSKIYFANSLESTLENDQFFTDSNIPEYSADFNGRVFLRRDYATNQIFDNISERFTGIGQTYTLTVGGANTTGLGTMAGNGIVFINGIFQTPTSQNNNLDVGSNYEIIENTNIGISSIVFSGIKRPDGTLSITDYDVNMNELPRGGLIVSLGSTPGLGYAPLVGASVTAVVGAGGSIVSIGIGTTGNWGSGYRSPVSIAITETGHSGTVANISANVGLGGTLSFNIVNGGSGYSNPTINISPPNYSNLSVTGVSRLGVGNTTETGVGLLVNVEVGASSTAGIGSTLFQVTNFQVTRPGYGFRRGDVLKVVGLVTDANLSNPVSEFELTVLETFTDSFSAWQFGEIDYIDNIKNYQDGIRTRFPLFYNSNLLSFEKDASNPESQLIDFNPLLIIFINGVLQQPGVAYEFTGGTTFTFTQAPKPEDNVAIFFYRGSSLDSFTVDVNETIKSGDDVQVFANNNYLGITTEQGIRTITEISSSDKIQTNTYTSEGIDIQTFKPLSWTKQKVDKIINGNFISKSRDSIETQIYPTAKIIRNLSATDTEIFVDNAEFFDYENAPSINFDGIIISGSADPVSGSVVASVSNTGTINSLTITNAGSGYTGSSIDVSISAPPRIGPGIGITATASISIVNGSLSTPITITNAGLGYTPTNSPQVLVPQPKVVYDEIETVSFVEGFSGNVTGIQTTAGIGTNLAIRFTLQSTSGLTGLLVGYPIYIFNTKVGNGVTSIVNNNQSVVGVGTSFLDNIYYVSAINTAVGIITCNIHSQSNIVGIATTGQTVGNFSWGRLSGFTRSSSPISIGVSGYSVDVGLSTFPTIQRRGYGLRDIGALKKIL